MKYADLTAGEHYAYDRSPKTAAYYSPSRVRLVSTDKYSPSPKFSNTRVRIADGDTTVMVSGRLFNGGTPKVAVCYDDPSKWDNYTLVSVSQLGSTWADWETTKAERGAVRAKVDRCDQLTRETRGRTIARITSRLAGVTDAPAMSSATPNVTVTLDWLESLIIALDREP